MTRIGNGLFLPLRGSLLLQDNQKCREIGFRACSLLFCAKSCKKWHEIGCFCSVSSRVSYGIRIGAEKIYGRFGITICAFFLKFSVFSEFLSMFWSAGKEWHSRGQRFDPAYLHHENRTSKRTSVFRGGGRFGSEPPVRTQGFLLRSKSAAAAAERRRRRNPKCHGGGLAAGVSRLSPP